MANQQNGVSAAFNAVAGEYDLIFGENPIIERLRKEIYSTIDFLIRPPARILDINCGTGTDGLYLAEKGYSIVGIDLAPQMIAAATRKSRTLKNASFVETSFENLGRLGSAQFDLVLSNFGGLNCIRDLSRVGEQVSERLKPGGYFVSVIMPPFALWETLAYALRGKFGEAFRRLRRNGTAAEFHGNAFMVYYFSLREVRRAFAADFDVIEVYALNVFSPPPHARNFAARFPGLTSGLEKFDTLICHLPVLRSIGDHTVIVMRRKTK